MNYYINSNSGDYVSENNGVYILNLIPRYTDHDCLHYERKEITPTQFKSLKGFIPIKAKKLFIHRKKKTYAPTLSDGSKGVSKRVELPTIAESRDRLLKELGL